MNYDLAKEMLWHPKEEELTYNERLVIISDIFKKLKLLKEQQKGLWYNETFDKLYEANAADLMQYDTHLRDKCIERFGIIQV